MNPPELPIPQDYLSRTFYERFLRGFPDERHSCTVTDRLEIVVPSPVAVDRELWVTIDPDEVQVGFGQFYHTHFSCYSYGDTPTDEVLDMVSDDAIEFIHAFLDDRIVVRVYFDGERVCGASTVRDQIWVPSTIMSYRDFIWTGELLTSHTTTNEHNSD